MTDIAKATRARLAEVVDPKPLLRLKETAKSPDGSVKRLWATKDDLLVESVLIPEKDHATLCLSSQAGCRLGCRFCATGALGFKRDLTRGEILSQALLAKGQEPFEAKPTNLVFMGMGEPLLNLGAVLGALEILTSPKHLAISGRRVSISTVGIPAAIQRLGQSPLNFGLTVSLGAPTNPLRDQLMPINREHPLEALKAALAAYPLRRGRRITVAYVLLKGVNDSQSEALALSRYLSGLKTKINLIPFNPWPGAPFERPGEEAIEKFRRTLAEKNHTVIVRWSKGLEVGAACGQLAGQKAKRRDPAETLATP
jgi:23S rRNA (adenine2503-C2)-methyltransferase